MKKQGRRYQEARQAVEPERSYSPEAAVQLAKQIAKAKFDETVELHLRTTSDPRHADQLIRGVVVLPHGTGKPVRVLVFAEGEAANLAREGGADYVGSDDLVKRIEEGWVDFDVSIATPDMMGKVGRLGRILGRRGLMPNPRTGTVVPGEDLPRTVRTAKQGRVEFRMDRTAIIHVSIGKASFEEQALLSNLATLVETVMAQRPSAVKGQFIRSAYLTTTMGPSIRLDLPTILALKAG